MGSRPNVLISALCCLALLTSWAQVVIPPVQAAPPAAAKGSGVKTIAFSPDGALIASAGEDGSITLWEAATVREVRTLDSDTEAVVTNLAFSPDGATLASASLDSVVRLWEVASGRERRALNGHENGVTAVAFSPDGGTLASAGRDTKIMLWEAATGRLTRTLFGHADFVDSVAFSPDGRALASGGKDARLRLWEPGAGRERLRLGGHAGAIHAVAFSPDGATVASAGDDAVKLWDAGSGQARRSLASGGAAVRAVAFSKDGKTVVSGGDDRAVRVRDAGSGQDRVTMRGNAKAVKAVAISPDGKTVAAGDDDGDIKLFDASNGQERRSFRARAKGPGRPAGGGAAPRSAQTAGAEAAEAAGAEALAADATAASPGDEAMLQAAALPPDQGPGGPILVVTTGGNKFGKYYAEILRNEGLNAFAVSDIGAVNAAMLGGYDVVILAEMTLTAGQVTMFTTWVNGGGNLIAMKPDAQLSGLLGLTSAGATLANGYLLVNTAGAPGAGIVNQTIQYRGTADRYTLNGATGVATLYSNATTATSNPAVTLRGVGGSGGQAAAFTYDLARSVVYQRQGNPAWAGQERDGFSPIRSDDLYFGAAVGDVQPDWVDLNKVAIPQADEQQRLLANLILHVNADKKPLPRFWYLPRGVKAAVLLTGDDHANGGTAGRFDQHLAASPGGCSVANWECVRSTSYIYPNSPLTNAQATAYANQGFEVALHVTTNCADFTPASLAAAFSTQLSAFTAKYTGVPALATERTHCLVWSDWAGEPKTLLSNGMRLDTNYYYWPPSWLDDRPGMFTASGMPMRFADIDGAFIDVYQATTQMTDESGQSYPFTVEALLDRAVGPEGYYGVFTVNAHTDSVSNPVNDAVVAAAQARGVPIVSARQALTWLDGRNDSTYSALTWNGSTLSFTVTPGAGTTGLRVLIPAAVAGAALTGVTFNGSPVTYTTETIKGIAYAFVPVGAAGAVSAAYASDTTPPTITNRTPAPGATGVAAGTTVTATFSEAMDAGTINTTTVELRQGGVGGTLVPAGVAYNATTRVATLTPTAALAYGTSYTAIVKGGSAGVKDAAGNALAADSTWSFTTVAGPSCPCSIWSPSATPTTPASNDASAVELGVKFRADVAGYITGVRFYKGSGNSGTHVGHLWSSTGTLLATATFTGETATGWQQVSFASPVAVSANTTYVASYHAPNGRYALNNGFFSTTGVDNAPLHALRDGVDGGNGLYRYGASAFPNQTYQASNYWVDVVFSTTAPADTTPPTVTATTPTDGATGVAVGSTVTATFSEPMDPSTINTGAFELRDAASALVPAAVTYDAASRTATLDPTATLAAGATYTAIVKGGATDPRVKDVAGNALAANQTWSFTTAAPVTCPCSFWAPSATPATAASGDTSAVELGVKFRADVAGFITGVRFYKGAGNGGTHLGRLWSSGGTQLATATFTGETASGWQQVSFASPVAVTANTTYLASYYAPVGRYALNANYFASTGVDNGPLHALRNGVDGGNGVYRYGSGGGFPNSSFQSSNYWVDVVFVTSLGPDTTPPTVTATTPTSGATGVAVGATVTATFSEPMDAATLNTNTFELHSGNASGPLVAAGPIAYDAASRTATLDPTATLAAGATYTAIVKGGATDPRVKDVAGNALAANQTWSFTTAAPVTCPCSIWAPSATPAVAAEPDPSAIEVGVKFRSDVAGSVTAIRFYKGAGNSGTHVGHLWSSTGTLLASVTFTGETATGWQQATLSSPVAIAANTTYVVSYYAPNGRYAVDEDYFASSGVDNGPLHALRDGVDGPNGLYRYVTGGGFPTETYLAGNYWVDIVLTTS